MIITCFFKYLRKLPLLLPYDVMQYLISDCGLTLEEQLVENYWSHLDSIGDPWAASNREWRTAVGSRNVWPLALYGDEANINLVTDPYNKIFGLVMSVVLFRPTATRLSRFVLFSLDSSCIRSVIDTWYPVLERIVESFNKLTEQGIQGRYFVVSEIRGDQAFFRYLFKHASWWTRCNMCFRCAATTRPTNLNYAIYEAPDGWNTTCRTTQDFIHEELDHTNLCHLAAQFLNHLPAALLEE